jgi:hypothetical protein
MNNIIDFFRTNRMIQRTLVVFYHKYQRIQYEF